MCYPPSSIGIRLLHSDIRPALLKPLVSHRCHIRTILLLTTSRLHCKVAVLRYVACTVGRCASLGRGSNGCEGYRSHNRAVDRATIRLSQWTIHPLLYLSPAPDRDVCNTSIYRRGPPFLCKRRELSTICAAI